MTRLALLTERPDLANQVGTLADADGSLWVRPWRNGHPFEASDIVAGIAATGDPAVVCVGDDVPLDLALQVATVADRDHRADMSVVLIAEPSADLWRDAVRAGVRDVVAPTTLDDELVPALGRALDWTARLGDHKVVADNTPTTGRVIVVLSPKGGSGKTMLSSNLTAALAGAVDGPVALVDLDVQFGDTAFALGLVPEHTIGQLAAAPTLDSTALKVFLTRHEASGAFVLCGSDTPEEGETVTDELASGVVGLLAKDFAYVIVDTPAGLDERTLAVLEHATDVVLVSSLDVSSIRSLGKEIDALERLGLLPETRHFLLNRADARVGIDVADVQAALRVTVDAQVPSSRAIPLSMNQGRPVVIDEPGSPAARELVRFARRFVPGTENTDETERPSGILRRRKNR